MSLAAVAEFESQPLLALDRKLNEHLCLVFWLVITIVPTCNTFELAPTLSAQKVHKQAWLSIKRVQTLDQTYQTCNLTVDIGKFEFSKTFFWYPKVPSLLSYPLFTGRGFKIIPAPSIVFLLSRCGRHIWAGSRCKSRRHSQAVGAEGSLGAWTPPTCPRTWSWGRPTPCRCRGPGPCPLHGRQTRVGGGPPARTQPESPQSTSDTSHLAIEKK